MGKKFVLVFLSALLLVFFSGLAMAQHEHGQKGKSHEMSMKSEPVQSVTVEGLKVTFEVMDMSMHMSMRSMEGKPMHGADHSKSHAIMVTVQEPASKEIISDAKMTYAILSPSGGKETGKLEWSGDHYGGGFSPKGKGTYQVQLMIESGGMEREAKFTYKAN